MNNRESSFESKVIDVPIVDHPGKVERIPVEVLPSGSYRALVSPGMALGFAKGDVFCVRDNRVEVEIRSGNVSVQIHFGKIGVSVEEVAIVDSHVGQFGGEVDARTQRIFAVTFPVSRGLRAISACMDALIQRIPRATWMFGNVYDPDDGHTPLNWWDGS